MRMLATDADVWSTLARSFFFPNDDDDVDEETMLSRLFFKCHQSQIAWMIMSLSTARI